MFKMIKNTTFDELLDKIPKYPENWKSEDVSIWLEHIGMQTYIPNFLEMSVDGLLILELTDDDLQNELGIGPKLHRKKILNAINQLHRYNAFLQEQAEREADVLLNTNKLQTKTEPEVIREEEILTTDQNLREEERNSSFENEDREDSVGLLEEECMVEGFGTEAPKNDEDFIVVKSIEGPNDMNFTVGEDGITIGRHSSNKIVIFDESVSRYHAKVVYRENGFWLVDIGSTTGTFVKITEPLELREGLIIEIGSYQFIVEKVVVSMHASFEQKREHSFVDLVVYEAPEEIEDKKFTLRNNDSIGRKNTSTISFNDDLHMSNLHCKVILIQDRFVLEDIASTNGTWLRLSEESLESEEVLLNHHMVFKIGNSAMYEIDGGELKKKEGEKEAEEKEVSNTACSICWEEERDCLIIPCRHNVTCLKCVKSVKNCPICRTPIEDLLRIFKC